MKIYNIPITPKLVKKPITDLDSSNLFGLDRNEMVILTNYDAEIL